VYVAGTPGPNQGRLLKVLAGHSPKDASRFRRQKQLLGYCHTTNVLAGEWYRQHGDVVAAEREFREITEQEPDNPWGWYLLAELYAELHEKGMDAACYRSVLAVLPQHGPSLAALGAKK
jgi:predicted Zn-dependent protease